MSGISTRTWDAADHLRSRDDMAAYLEAALESELVDVRTIPVA